MQPGDTFTMPTSVSFREVGDQILLANLDSGNYHELNEAGSLVWRKVMGGAPFDELVAELCANYEVSADVAREDVRELLTQLCAKGLLEPA